MAEETGIQQAVENAVRKVLANHLPKIEEELARQVLEEVQPFLQAAEAPASTDVNAAAELAKAVALIQTGTTQKEILHALLDSTQAYAGRVALFVVKGVAATGWLGRGFADDSRIRDFHLNLNQGVASQAFHSRVLASGGRAEADAEFVSAFGLPSGPVIVLPLLLKDKVAALVYADGGADGRLSPPALEVVVAATSAWLEVSSRRKQSQSEMTEEAGEKSEAIPVSATQSATSFPDPFAAHAPHHAAAASLTESPVAAEAERSMATAAGATAAAVPTMSAEDADVHRKAQRFARLLMDEIKLYNQAKVAEGRKSKDLYDRLKEDIEKSRATYMKRYGNTVASQGDYFSAELVRSLAEDDVSLLGANFRR